MPVRLPLGVPDPLSDPDALAVALAVADTLLVADQVLLPVPVGDKEVDAVEREPDAVGVALAVALRDVENVSDEISGRFASAHVPINFKLD